MKTLAPVGLAALVISSLACSADEARLQPYPLPVAVVGSATVSLERLRMVTIFENEDRELAFGPDVAVTSTGTLMQVDLLPPPEDFGPPRRQTPLVLTADGQGLLVARPRFVAYLDEDGSGRYQDGRGFHGPDTTVGIEAFTMGVAWLPSPEEEIGRLSPEAADAYYRATEDRYTAFVPVVASDSEFQLRLDGLGVTIDISRLSVAAAETVCDHRLFNAADPEPRIRLWVDRSLDAQSLCGLDLSDRRPVDTSTLTPPLLPEGPPINPFVRTYAQCRRRAGFEVLVVEENRVRCDPNRCACNDHVDVESVATSTSARPPWWPCGDTVDYCESNRPLYRADPACEPPDEEDDG